MPRYTPQVAKAKAKKLIKDYNIAGLNQSRLAKENNCSQSNISQKLSKLPVKETMSALLDKASVTDMRLANKIDEGLEAIKIDSLNKVPDHNARHKYVITALEIKGHVKHNSKEDDKPKGDTYIFANITNTTSGRPVGEVLAELNSRLSAQFIRK